jgi:nucleoside-diphosphate-sugar epimerase
VNPSANPPGRPRILVTGSNGFIGRALVGHFLEIGAVVHGIDITASRDPGETMILDLVDRTALKTGLDKARPEYVFHAAGVVSEDEARLDAAHVETTRSLLEGVRSVCPGARVVIVGSAAEYGCPNESGPLKEGTKASPVSAYGRSKLRQSELARRLAADWGLDVVRVRLFNTLGPGQGPHLVAGATVERLRRAVADHSGWLDVFDPESRRDFLDVRDAARLLWLTASRVEPEPDRPPVHVATGVGTTIEELARTLLEVSGHSGRTKMRLVQNAEPTSIIGEAATLRKILGEDPLIRINLRESLLDMWNWAGASHPLQEAI